MRNYDTDVVKFIIQMHGYFPRELILVVKLSLKALLLCIIFGGTSVVFIFTIIEFFIDDFFNERQDTFQYFST